MFVQLEIWGSLQVWRQAATQVFFALGLGYGSVIAYSSYNPVHNNCHRDALMVSCINFMTSVLATLVVFVVLGFRAKTIALGCVAKYECVCVRVGAWDSETKYVSLFDSSFYFAFFQKPWASESHDIF